MRAVVRLGCAFVLCCAGVITCFAQEAPAAATPSAPATIRSELDKEFSFVEQQVVSAADAMPEDKYSFVPTTGEYKTVRNFGDQVKHIADKLLFLQLNSRHGTSRAGRCRGVPRPRHRSCSTYAIRSHWATRLSRQLLRTMRCCPCKHGCLQDALGFGRLGNRPFVRYLRPNGYTCGGMNSIVPPASRQRTE